MTTDSIAHKSAKMGLPEVNLGLIPGAGGTVRLPRLVSADFALNMIASGKPVSATQALNEGLIDEIAEDELIAAGLASARSLSDEVSPTLVKKPLKIENISAFETAKAKILAKARGQNSIGAAIRAVEYALEMDPSKALTEERSAFKKLSSSPQSKALRHIFFAERATLSDPRCKAQPRIFDHIGIVGGGTMGAGIAAACLLAGLQITMIETTLEAAERGKDRVLKTLADTSKRGLITEEKRLEFESRFLTDTDFSSLSGANMVIEAVFEDLSVKKSVFKTLDLVTSSDTILATNTSYLDVGEVAESVSNPSRVLGLHFFSPAHIMKLLEIVLPVNVSNEAVATAAAFAKRLKKTAVLSGVCDGFIGNRIMSAYRKEADYLVEDGALPHDVDRAMRDFGFPIGIYEMQDMAGLDISWAMRKRQAATRNPQERYVEIADRLCEQERFGKKTGKGWYHYTSGKSETDPAVTEIIVTERARKNINPKAFTDIEIMDRILSSMQSEAQRVLNEGIALKADDIDVVMTSGYGFPRWRGGPMFMKSNNENLSERDHL